MIGVRPMSDTFMNWTSRVAIAGRVAQQRRLSYSSDYLPGGYRLPFDRVDVRAEVLKWLWRG